jgi:hypothetical protein
MRLTLAATLFVTAAALNNANAQPTTYDFRVIAQPGMTIGGHTFTPRTTIESVALNDAGNVVFLAHWNDAGAEYGGIFTADRIIAMESAVIDANRIGTITKDCAVAINNAGQIAFSAPYGDVLDLEMENARWGIFVDKHLMLRIEDYEKVPAFMLSEDGQVTLNPPVKKFIPAPEPAPAKLPKKTLLDRIPIKPPVKLPGNVSGFKTQTISSEHCPVSPFLGLPANHNGQFLIPINFPPGGFVLLLATPTTR